MKFEYSEYIRLENLNLVIMTFSQNQKVVFNQGVGVRLKKLTSGRACMEKVSCIYHIHYMYIPTLLAGFHTHKRHDRDSHIVINWDNISPSKKKEFELCSGNNCDSWGYPYDCNSIMHYAKNQMSKNGQDSIGKYVWQSTFDNFHC